MNDVVQADDIGMLFLEQTNALFQVRTMVADDAHRNADLFGKLIKLALNDLARGLVNRDQRQSLHVTMLQRPGELLVLLVADSQDHQTFRDTALDGVVGNPDPVVGSFFRPGEFVQPQPKQQILDGRMRWPGMWLAMFQLENKIQATCSTSQAGGGFQNKAYD